MKISKVIVGLLACWCLAATPSVAEACHHKITSVSLDPVTACPGDEVQVTVNVELYGKWYSVQKWKSTSIDGVCYDNPNHYSSDGRQNFTEVFTMLAPGTQGLGNVQVKTFAGENCTSHKKTVNVDLTVIYCCPQCEDGDDCTVEQGDGFVAITCGETVAYLYDGEDGTDGDPGPPGPPGIPGFSCSVEQDGLCAHISCEDGTSATVCDGEPGEDGESCYVEQDGDCAVITCGDDTSTTVCDGQDGDDGRDGDSCWVENFPRMAVIHCGESTATVVNGLNCWDLNGNRRRDFCAPRLRRMFDGECPDEFLMEYQCELPDGLTSKAVQMAKTYEGSVCETDVGCVEYVFSMTDLDYTVAEEVCNFTEDTNADGSVDVLDCRGDDGADGSDGVDGQVGSTGLQGEPGIQGPEGPAGPQGDIGPEGPQGPVGEPGQNGVDGEGCEVVDNLDATCTVVCGKSEVIVHNCGEGAEPVEEVITDLVPEEAPTTGVCGAFGGISLVAMLPLLGLMKLRSRKYHL